MLLGFFAFLRLLNLAPYALLALIPPYWSGCFLHQKYAKVLIKWSKTVQTRDNAQCLILPKLKNKIIWPYRALKAIFKLYPMSADSSLLQLPSQQGLNPMTDSHVKKIFKRINIALGLPSNYFTFHDLRRSGATLAFHSHVPIQDIKRHSTWSSDCMWCYIQLDHSSLETLANALALSINAL